MYKRQPLHSDAADHHDHSDEFHLFLRDVPAGGRSINDSDVSAQDGVYPGRTDPVPPDLPEGIDDPGKQHVYAAPVSYTHLSSIWAELTDCFTSLRCPGAA